MPIYVYECETCNFTFEIKQEFKDKSLTTCASCGGDLHKIIHAPAVIFKGDGWYITDSRKQTRKINLGTGDQNDSGEIDSE